MKIAHIAIWTNNLEGLRKFYSTHFHCSASARYENPQKKFSSYFLSFKDGAAIELMQRGDITEPPGKEMTGLAHFAIEAGTKEQVDLLTETLEKAGVRVFSYPRTTGDGYYESVIMDPDGNRIELVAQR
ncbi:MAG: VOC family protein [Sphingobacteriia bacterium]|nr:VOC family protein [Sphingobacteriia bacterium]